MLRVVESWTDLEDKGGMNRMIRKIALLAVLVLWTVMASAQGTEERVSFVPDGDTLVLAGGETVRLAGIDAPELAHDGRPAQAYGSEAMRTLEAMTRDRLVIVVPVGKGRDRHGRLLAVVRSLNGKMLNEAMLEEGLAFVYPHGDMEERFQSSLLRVQQRAMDLGKGFWPEILRLDSGRGKWVGNRRSLRFHTPACPDGQQISAKNRVLFPSLQNAFQQGYAPCRRCTPWPANRAEP
jgi:micrococcal nuclease